MQITFGTGGCRDAAGSVAVALFRVCSTFEAKSATASSQVRGISEACSISCFWKCYSIAAGRGYFLAECSTFRPAVLGGIDNDDAAGIPQHGHGGGPRVAQNGDIRILVAGVAKKCYKSASVDINIAVTSGNSAMLCSTFQNQSKKVLQDNLRKGCDQRKQLRSV